MTIFKAKIDPVLFQEQRRWLLFHRQMQDEQPDGKIQYEDEIDGLLNFLDHIADAMADQGETRQLLTQEDE